jgi:VIT1/CCC1 family predicted Fe2+/Mn2+ transporter
MEEAHRRRLICLQRMEETEAAVYRALAVKQTNPENKAILERIASDEERHSGVLTDLTGVKVGPSRLKVFWHLLIARLLGLTFAVKMMERVETEAAAEYRALGLDELATEEDEHEAMLVGLLKEDRLEYLSSIVLGMSDALIELTGALAGLTFAFRDLRLIALAGLITGISAAFSMGASEYLSTRSEKKDGSPFKAALFTWFAYLMTVMILIIPYLLLTPSSPPLFGAPPYVQALGYTFAAGIIIVASFNFYVSVIQEESFKRRFSEMIAILGAVSLISYTIGLLLRGWLGI